MPVIEKYTRQTTPQQMVNVQANASSFGGNTTGLQAMAGASQDTAQALGQASQTIQGIAQKRQNREETIARVKAADDFYNQVFNEYNTALSEKDLSDPASSREFNEKIRTMANSFIDSFQGTPDAKARLQEEILGQASQFTRKMSENAINAQREFIMKKASSQINALAAEAAADPSKLPEIYTKASQIISDFSPAMYTEDELSLTDAATEQITFSALNYYMDSADYEGAKSFIEENDFILQNISPNKMRPVLQQINSGLAARNKEITETRQKIQTIRTVAQELNVDVDPAQLFSAATGIKQAETPLAKIETFAAAMGKDVSELTPAMIAKVGFDVDLPSESVDPNKERKPDGKLTAKGVQAVVQKPFERAASVKTYKDKVDGAIMLFRQDGNTQALLSAMITFQKALDEGAVVRGEDIATQRSAQSLSENIGLVIKRAQSGQVVGDELVSQMQQTMENFTMQVLESEKTFIEPYVDYTKKELGVNIEQIGIPQQSYDSVFGGVKTRQPEMTPDANAQKLTEKAQEMGVTVDELIAKIAEKSGRSPEEIKTQLGMQ